MSIGVMLGAPFGGLLSDVGGKRLPFLLVSGLLVIDAVARMVLLGDPPKHGPARANKAPEGPRQDGIELAVRHDVTAGNSNSGEGDGRSVSDSDEPAIVALEDLEPELGEAGPAGATAVAVATSAAAHGAVGGAGDVENEGDDDEVKLVASTAPSTSLAEGAGEGDLEDADKPKVPELPALKAVKRLMKDAQVGHKGSV